MDGISAASAVLQVVAVSLTLSQKIAIFILDARDVVETRTRFYDQVECLHDTVRSVHQVLERRQQQINRRPVGLDEEEVYVQTFKTLDKTLKTVEWLEGQLEKLGGGRADSRCWEKAWMQMKLQIRAPAIAKLERQIETSVSSLQLMLQCINPFIHEDTQAVVEMGFETTNASLIRIQETMEDLRNLMHCSLPGTNIGMIKEADPRTAGMREDPATSLEDIDDQASGMASECLSVANSLCGKISQPGTFIGSARQTIYGANEGPRGYGFQTDASGHCLSNTDGRDNEQEGVALFDTFLRKAAASIPTTVYARIESTPPIPASQFVERLEILTDHIDNDHRMAVEALQASDYSGAERHISEAMVTAKEREINYSFPFEDEAAYLEIFAYAQARNGNDDSAKQVYKNLLRKAESTSGSKDTEGRICFALAQLYRDQYRKMRSESEDEKTFEDWKNYALRAYESAINTPGRPDSDVLWKSHPSLCQTADMLAEMYECWEKPARALTYRQRHPSRCESTIASSAALLHTLKVVPPTPPDSDTELQRQTSQTSIDDSIFSDMNLTSLHTSTSTASGLLVLHRIEQNDFETTKYFLDLAEGSVDMEQRNERGLTPLLLAVQKRHTKIVRLLLEHEKKPDVTAKDKNGWTVLHYALSGWEGEDMVDILVEHGADVNAAAMDGTTPLHCAVNNNKLHGGKILLRHHVSTEVKDSAGRTPMFVAVQKKRLEMVAILVRGGAVCDRQAWTEDKPDLKGFFGECEDNGIIEPLSSFQQVSTPRRESIISTASRKSFFSRKPRKSVVG